MALKNPFKLQKLKISAYGDSTRSGQPEPKDTFTVMFNPETISMKHENVFQKFQGINTSGRTANYSHSRSDELELELVLDGTGVTDYGLATLVGKGTDSVSKQIETFLNCCFYMDGKLHEPKYLKIQWGDGLLADFDCRLQSVSIEYTSFDRNGAPLRAKLATSFQEDLDSSKRLRKEGKSSPDLSHVRIVRSGDTLPLLSKEIYGTSEFYLRVAEANNLDDFRNLRPGQEIIFPPLQK